MVHTFGATIQLGFGTVEQPVFVNVINGLRSKIEPIHNLNEIIKLTFERFNDIKLPKDFLQAPHKNTRNNSKKTHSLS